MIRSLRDRIYSNMQNYKRPDAIEHTATELRAFAILNKKAAPKKQLTLLQKKAYKVLKAPKPKKSNAEVLNLCRTLLGIEVKLKEITTPKGLKIYAKEFKPGADVFISTAKNEVNISLPIGKYPLGRNRFLVVQPEGIIKTIN
jgi:hypothetical protein